MKQIILKYYRSILILLIVLVCVFIYRIDAPYKPKETPISPLLKDKEIVTVWMKEGPDTETRKYQVDKYNKENVDNIYISLNTYKEDYFNLLRISLSVQNTPDIFQYGYYELLKNNNLMDLNEAGINPAKLNPDNILYFQGVPIGVKLTGNNVKLVWNKTLVKKAGVDSENPPATWEDMLNYCRRIKKVEPDIIPFEFPFYTMDEAKIAIGEMSVNKGPIYTSFWNYSEGKYDFQYAKPILEIYNKMYNEGLIDINFTNKNKDNIRKDFYGKKCAMILSTFEDKNYFSNIIQLGTTIGISNLPKISADDKQNYYYTDLYNCVVINKNIQDKRAVRLVYEWLLDTNTNRELLTVRKALPFNIYDTRIKDYDIYPEYNIINNFKQEVYDPSIFLGNDNASTIKLFTSAIKGTKSIDEVIESLDKIYAANRQDFIDKNKFDYSFYMNR